MRKLKMLKILAMCVTLSMPIVSQAIPKPSNPRNEMRFIDLVDWNEISASVDASMASKTVKATPKPTVKPVASAKPTMLTFEQYKVKLESAKVEDYKNDTTKIASNEINVIMDRISSTTKMQLLDNIDLISYQKSPQVYEILVELLYYRDEVLKESDYYTFEGKSIIVSYKQVLTQLSYAIIKLRQGDMEGFRKYMNNANSDLVITIDAITEFNNVCKAITDLYGKK